MQLIWLWAKVQLSINFLQQRWFQHVKVQLYNQFAIFGGFNPLLSRKPEVMESFCIFDSCSARIMPLETPGAISFAKPMQGCTNQWFPRIHFQFLISKIFSKSPLYNCTSTRKCSCSNAFIECKNFSAIFIKEEFKEFKNCQLLEGNKFTSFLPIVKHSKCVIRSIVFLFKLIFLYVHLEVAVVYSVLVP